MRYAGIKLHSAPRVDVLLAAFAGHQVVKYKATPENTEWYNGVVAALSEKDG